jgi:hypothetical protein
MVAFSDTPIGLLMMLPNEEVERVSLRAPSDASARRSLLLRRRLRKMRAMKAQAATSRTAPTAAPAMTAVGVPELALGCAVSVDVVSAPELAPLLSPGVEVVVGEGVGTTWVVL